jgi:RNA 3'-terminal phosphate cyclase (ATP)
LLLPLALAGGGEFTAVALDGHATTNMEVIGKFLPVRFVVENRASHVRVAVGGIHS